MDVATQRDEGRLDTSSLEDLTTFVGDVLPDPQPLALDDGMRMLLVVARERIFVTDRHGRCTVATAGGARLLGGRDARDAVGVDVHERLGHIDAAGAPCKGGDCEWLSAVREGRSVVFAGLRLHPVASAPLTAECRLYPIVRAGLVDGCVVTVSEVSPHVTATVAHELRNPLQAIRFAAGGLRSDRRSALLARTIDAAVGRMDALIGDLLLVASAASPQGITLRRRRADVAAACRVAVSELRVSRPRAKITLDARGSTRALIDPDRLVQVVVNLVANAIDHGAARSAVGVSVRGEADQVVIAVHNDGEPIPARDLVEVFAPYRRGRSASPGTGLGLGLYIARAIVEAHEGLIEAQSSPDAGTTFIVTLPQPGARSALDSQG